MRSILLVLLAFGVSIWMMKGHAVAQGRMIWTQDARGGRLASPKGVPLLDVSATSPLSATPWNLEAGRLVFPQSRVSDTFAIHQRPLPPGDKIYEADLRVVEGDVAGLVFNAAPGGAPCYGVLLGARSRSLRVVYLPWPGADLHIASAPIERNRLHRLRVSVQRRGNATRFEIALDGQPITTYEDNRYAPAGSHCGAMANSSVSHFERLAVYERQADGTPGAALLEEVFGPQSRANYAPHALPFPARWQNDTLTFETRFPASGQGMGAVAQLRHAIATPRHIWLPHLSPYEDTVIGDHSFRSPAIILADEQRVLALIPHLDDVRHAQQNGWRVWLDYDHPRRLIRVAAGSYEVGRFHVGYQAAPLAYQGQRPRVRLAVLTSERREDTRNPYGMVARRLWQMWGRAGYAAGGSQRAPMSRYETKKERRTSGNKKKK